MTSISCYLSRLSLALSNRGMARLLLTCAIAGSLLLAQVSSTVAQDPVGTIKIIRRSVAEGVGLSWGDGVLTFGGSSYPFTFQARGLLRGVDPRLAATELSGQVFNLNKLEDFAGNYQKITDNSPPADAGRATIRNKNGVTVILVSSVKGRMFNLGSEGLDVELKKSK